MTLGVNLAMTLRVNPAMTLKECAPHSSCLRHIQS